MEPIWITFLASLAILALLIIMGIRLGRVVMAMADLFGETNEPWTSSDCCIPDPGDKFQHNGQEARVIATSMVKEWPDVVSMDCASESLDNVPFDNVILEGDIKRKPVRKSRSRRSSFSMERAINDKMMILVNGKSHKYCDLIFERFNYDLGCFESNWQTTSGSFLVKHNSNSVHGLGYLINIKQK